jgi:hypothetical protein
MRTRMMARMRMRMRMRKVDDVLVLVDDIFDIKFSIKFSGKGSLGWQRLRISCSYSTLTLF